MWQPAIGFGEIILLALVSFLLWFSGRYARRLAQGIVPCFVVAMAVTPSDPASMLIVGIPLAVAFTCGVLFSPRVRLSDGDQHA